jgi:hypothetical protein
MSPHVDKIGVVRDHRWIKGPAQRARLEAEGCRGILELGRESVTQNDMIKMATAGRTFVVTNAFLLADPRQRVMRGGMRASFNKTVEKIIERGGVIHDLETNLTTADKRHRKAIAALAYDHIARSLKSRRSSINGSKSRGRPAYAPSDDETKRARAIWRNTKDYRTWDDAVAALEQEVPKFTAARAFKTWGGRK